MDNQLLIAIVGIMAVLIVLLTVVMLWLLRQHKKLKQNLQIIETKIQRNGEDVAGLCSAAVAVDQRLAVSETRFDNLFDSMNNQPKSVLIESQDPQPQGYDLAIEKIRRGASVDELVKSCALTRDEAMLLIRLHGNVSR